MSGSELSKKSRAGSRKENERERDDRSRAGSRFTTLQARAKRAGIARAAAVRGRRYSGGGADRKNYLGYFMGVFSPIKNKSASCLLPRYAAALFPSKAIPTKE